MRTQPRIDAFGSSSLSLHGRFSARSAAPIPTPRRTRASSSQAATGDSCSAPPPIAATSRPQGLRRRAKGATARTSEPSSHASVHGAQSGDASAHDCSHRRLANSGMSACSCTRSSHSARRARSPTRSSSPDSPVRRSGSKSRCDLTAIGLVNSIERSQPLGASRAVGVGTALCSCRRVNFAIWRTVASLRAGHPCRNEFVPV